MPVASRERRDGLFAGRHCLYRERVHPITRQVTQCLIDHALARDAIDTGKGSAFNLDREMAFPGTIIACMAAMFHAVVNHRKTGGIEGGGQQRLHFNLDRAFRHAYPLPISQDFGQGESMSAPRNPDRFHGRMRGSRKLCEHPRCERAGEFRAPNPYGRQPGPNGPGDYLYFCLDHVREYNAGYDWFEGMSAEEISKAQSPLNVWPSETRAFRPNGGADTPPRWADFSDPLEAITSRFKGRMEAAAPPPRADGTFLTSDDREALKTLELDQDADRKAIRSAYSRLVRKYHPDKNGGDRAYESRLQAVVNAYQHLRSTPLFS